MTSPTFSLPQSERINSKKQIDRLFRGGGSKAMTASPLRVVYMAEERGENDGETVAQPDEQPAPKKEPMAQMMVSVPKRFFKRAVKRNRIKRQVREAYRLNKHILTDELDKAGHLKLSMCFIWTADRMLDTAEVEQRMTSLLNRLREKLYALTPKADASKQM